MDKKVVITGIGVISPLGFGKEDFWRNLAHGRSGIGPVSSFDLSSSLVRVGGEVKDFHPETYLGSKGLRYVQRGTKMLSSAIKLAVEDARLQVDEDLSRHTGLVVGTAFGNFIQTTEYTQRIMTSNPSELLPMDGFDAALNSAINYTTVHYKLKTCARTFSSGFASGIDAVADGARLIRFGQAQRVVAGGFEQLSPDNYMIYSIKEQMASPLRNGEPLSMPFDRRRNGFIPGEGCWLFVLEAYEVAASRGAKIYAEIGGYGGLFLGNRRLDREQKIGRMKRVIERAVNDAGLAKEEVELVSAAAHSGPEYDLVEGKAIKEYFGDNVLVTATKSMLGECFGASGAMQLASALLSIDQAIVPPTINYNEIDSEIDLRSVVTTPRQQQIRVAAVNAFDLSANSSCLLLKSGRE